MSQDYEFELRAKGMHVARFESDVNPLDKGECVDLLRTQARSHKKRVGDCELVVKRYGRVMKRYRAAA